VTADPPASGSHTWPGGYAWPTDADALAAEQARLAALAPEPWAPPGQPADLLVAAAFVAFVRGEQGPGHPGDRAWVGAVLQRGRRVAAEVVVRGVAGASYRPGLLALREGPMLAAALEALPQRPDVLLVDATGRDHPRRAGLALHLGAALRRPSVGVTHRPLRASGPEPGPAPGSTAPLTLDGDVVAHWVRTARGVRPVVAHAGWRTDAAVAVEVVLRCAEGRRTPEPLRQARRVAREARAAAE
jgi:deoxyribonuclease V